MLFGRIPNFLLSVIVRIPPYRFLLLVKYHVASAVPEPIAGFTQIVATVDAARMSAHLNGRVLSVASFGEIHLFSGLSDEGIVGPIILVPTMYAAPSAAIPEISVDWVVTCRVQKQAPPTIAIATVASVCRDSAVIGEYVSVACGFSGVIICIIKT